MNHGCWTGCLWGFGAAINKKQWNYFCFRKGNFILQFTICNEWKHCHKPDSYHADKTEMIEMLCKTLLILLLSYIFGMIKGLDSYFITNNRSRESLEGHTIRISKLIEVSKERNSLCSHYSPGAFVTLLRNIFTTKHENCR